MMPLAPGCKRWTGHRAASLESTEVPPRTSLQEIAPSRFRHAMATADAIVHTLAACHESGVKVQRAIGDGRLTLAIGEYRQQPDLHFQLGYAGRTFNLVFEIDNATEPLDSRREQSIRTELSQNSTSKGAATVVYSRHESF